MKLEKWALIAEIVGSVAVVVTLIFLIIEVRGNTEASLAANRQSLAGRTEALLMAEATSRELEEVIAKANQETPLDAVEAGMYASYVAARVRSAEEAFLQFREGQLSEQYFRTRGVSAVRTMDNEQAQAVWTRWKDQGYFTSEFSDWFDQALQETYRSTRSSE